MTQTYPPPAPAPSRPPWLIPVLVASVVLIVALAGVATWALLRSSGPTAPTSATQTQLAAQPVTQPKPAEVPAPKYTPTELDFVLKVKVTSKQCFGSAGCNVEYHIDLTYTGDTLDDSDTWLITYEVSGVEDGPAINTLKLTGDQYSYDETEFAQTRTSTVKLKAKVTDIEKQ